MTCFLVSAAEAAVVTAVAKAEEKKDVQSAGSGRETEGSVSIPLSRKLKWLTYMLWGGVAMLALEHLWHGEIVPWFPFLTAVSDPANTAEMLKEMEGLDQSEMSAAELAYYLEVTGRIYEKLAKVAQF